MKLSHRMSYGSDRPCWSAWGWIKSYNKDMTFSGILIYLRNCIYLYSRFSPINLLETSNFQEAITQPSLVTILAEQLGSLDLFPLLSIIIRTVPSSRHQLANTSNCPSTPKLLRTITQPPHP